MARLLVLMTGGTLAQAARDGRMAQVRTLSGLLEEIETPHTLVPVELDLRAGADLAFTTARSIASILEERARDVDGAVILTGTDGLEELAFLLDVGLGVDLPVVLTGAMCPDDLPGRDGPANLDDSLRTAAATSTRDRGVLVVMNATIHAARRLRKTDTGRRDAFLSDPGPVGEVRRGVPIFAGPPAPPDRPHRLTRISRWEGRVPILTVGIDLPFPHGLLDGIAGLVIAGPGTSSLPHAWRAALKAWTDRLPIALTSRCLTGPNVDEHTYRGSLARDEGDGFIVSEVVDLTPWQARLSLCLSLSDTETPS